MHKISPSCSVFETNLKAYSFEVVVTGQVLHLQGCSFEDSLRWIATLKAAINNSPPDDTDPLLAEALRLEDTFYYVRSYNFVGCVSVTRRCICCAIDALFAGFALSCSFTVWRCVAWLRLGGFGKPSASFLR